MRALIGAAFLGLLIGGGIASAIFLWEPWNGEDELLESAAIEKVERKLTGTEAAALAQEDIAEVGGEQDPRYRENAGFFDCKSTDFNETLDAWIVRCVLELPEGDFSLTFRVYDLSGRVELIAP